MHLSLAAQFLKERGKGPIKKLQTRKKFKPKCIMMFKYSESGYRENTAFPIILIGIRN